MIEECSDYYTPTGDDRRSEENDLPFRRIGES
jgi:hypothetical protein